jgi:hypothetical protein
MPDELKIVLEDVKEKFDTVIKGINLISEKLDRQVEENKKEHEGIKSELLHLRRDLNEHRNNTELHGQKKEKAS